MFFLFALVSTFLTGCTNTSDIPDTLPDVINDVSTETGANDTGTPVVTETDPPAPPAVSELPVTPGDWHDIVIPYGFDGDQDWAWDIPATSLPPMSDDMVEFQVNTAGTAVDLNGDGLPELLTISYKYWLTAWCQDGPTYTKCPASMQPPPTLGMDIASWKTGEVIHVIILSLEIPGEPQSFMDSMMTAMATGAQPEKPASNFVHFTVTNGKWHGVESTPLPARGEYTNLAVVDMNGDGWLDAVATTAPLEPAVALRGGPNGFAIAEDAFAPPGNGRGGFIPGAWHDDGRREWFTLSFGQGTGGGPSGTVCSLGNPGNWTDVPCQVTAGSIMGGAIGGPGEEPCLLTADVGNEGLFCPPLGSKGLITDSNQWQGFESSDARGLLPRDPAEEFRTGWSTLIAPFDGSMGLTAMVANSWDVAAHETWNHPLTCYAVGERWNLDAPTAFGPNLDIRGLIGPADLNKDNCPDLVGNPVFAQHVMPSTGIHVLMNGTCAGTPQRVEFRSESSDQPAFGAMATVRASNGAAYTVGIVSGGGAGSHRSAADLYLPADATEIEVTWPDGQITTHNSPFPGVLRH